MASIQARIVGVAVTTIALAVPVEAGASHAGTTVSIVGTATNPSPHGNLIITGSFSDGSTLTATGVTWQPAPCDSQGVCSRALTVSYSWLACSSASCGPTGIAVTQPYINTYVPGTGDVGKKMQVTETATDVRTDDSVQTARIAYESSSRIAAWPAGTTPRVDLIHGLPESVTTSTRESFVLSPSHANPANGPVGVSCALDSAAYSTTCGATRSFTTSALATGAHQFRVRALNGAGTRVTSFSWTVVPQPQPAACVSCYHPPHLDSQGHPMTWDWQLTVAGTSLVYRKVDLFDIDGFNNSSSIVTKIHARAGKTLPHEKAICYVSLGSWENFRADAPSWPARAIGLTLLGFDNEQWVDVRQLGALKPIIDARLKMCASKGFDGVEVDNIDGWDGNATGFPLTREDTKAWLTYISNKAHALNLFIVWKNDPILAAFGVRYFDGALSEQCYSTVLCTPADNSGNNDGCNLTSNPCGASLFAAAGKWVGEVEYPPTPDQPGVCDPGQNCSGAANFTTFCNTTWRLPPKGFGFAAWRAEPALDGHIFYACWL